MKHEEPKRVVVRWGTTPKQFTELLASATPETIIECPKCHAASGEDWSQCRNWCPMPCSPRYSQGMAHPYDLSDPNELKRLYRELKGYMLTSLKDGTDHEGRRYAYDALVQLVARDEEGQEC